MTPTLNCSNRIVIVASTQELRDPHYQARLRLAARNTNISRRKWPDALAETIYDFKGTILCPDGRKWPVPDIDEVMGNPRWFGYMFELDDNGDFLRPVRLTERLRIIDLYFRIAKPNIAKHFGR